MATLRGSFTTTHLRSVKYGPGTIDELFSVMEDVLAQDKDKSNSSSSSDTPIKAMIVTGTSLSKTPVIPQVEKILKDKQAYAATFTSIRQHTPIDDLEAALKVMREEGVTILIGVGGGSPIDACKTLSYFHNERFGSFIPHIAIPTTLSAAEFTMLAGHTNKEGNKTGVMGEPICPKAVILDPRAAQYTPLKLWLSTGIRALDHASEILYRPGAAYPLQQLALAAIRDLFVYLPQCSDAKNEQDLTARGRTQVAAWMSLFPARLDTALGPSHALGHALGATYSIPHGYCSVLTLPGTCRAMAQHLPSDSPGLKMLAEALTYLPSTYTSSSKDIGSASAGARAVADALDQLIKELGLKVTLQDYKVPKEHLEKIAEESYKSTSAKPGWKEVCPTKQDMLDAILLPAYA